MNFCVDVRINIATIFRVVILALWWGAE